MDRYNEVITYFNDIIKTAEKTENYLLMKTMLFSIIESMAQEYCNYCSKNTEVFVRFVSKFSNVAYLNKIDPITTYYEMKHKGYKINTNLDYLEDGYNYSAKQIVDRDGTQEIICEAQKYGINLDKHKYINLIYKYRCKLVHECKSIGINFKSLEEKEDINYISCGFNIKWELNIPYTFLKKLTKECIEGYIKECKEIEIDPYKNAKKYSYWYE